MTLVNGHEVGGRVYVWPHVCPGPGCAIEAWLIERDRSVAYRLERASLFPSEGSYVSTSTEVGGVE